MKIRTVKGVDEETWKLIKNIAVREKLKIGVLLKEMAKEYKKKPSSTWNDILNTNPIFTKEEAENIKRGISKIRHEYGFRR